MPTNILITGCSGGGKSTLLAALAAQGHQVVPEPGLRVLRSETARGGRALPWVDMQAFLMRSAEVARSDLATRVGTPGPIFFDRGLLDAAVGLHHHCGVPVAETLGPVVPYAARILVAPPWRSCFAQTPERRHSFEDAVAESERIATAIAELGLEAVTLPRAGIESRVAFVERVFPGPLKGR